MIKAYVCTCLLAVVSVVEAKALDVEGRVGKNVTVICSDWNAWTDVKHNVKYLCENPCLEDKHIIIKAAFKETKYKNRIKITNSAGGLVVTFINLTMSDSTKYYCGAKRLGPDSLIEVNLKVVDAEPQGPTTPAKTAHTRPTAPAMQEASTKGTVTYLTIGFIIIIATLTLLLKVMRTVTRKQKVASRLDSPQEEAQEDVEYDEIRLEDQQTERQPVAVSTVHFSTANTDADTDSLYANNSYLHATKLTAEFSSTVYSVAQVPKQRTERTGQSEAAEDDAVYSLIQLPEAI